MNLISLQNIITNNQETSFCEDHLVLKEEDMKDKDNSSQILENILLLETYNEGLKQNNMLNFAVNSYPAITHLFETQIFN